MTFVRIILPILMFVLGVVFASFGDVLVCRYPHWKMTKEEKYSECPHCHHRLAWYDLFPLFSYICLGGKCRYCKTKISSKYFMTELGGGFIFLLTYFLYVYFYHSGERFYMDIGFREEFSVMSFVNVVCIALSLLITLLGALIDRKHKEMPLSFSIALFVLALANWIVDFVMTGDYQLNTLLGLAIPLVLFGLIYAISTIFFKVEPIGIGDIIVFCSLGFLMGAVEFAIILLVSTILCSIVESIKIKKTGKKEQIAFVPYIFAGFMVSAFLGELIASGYLSLIGVR